MNIEKTLKQMTLEDKVALGSGKDFWHTKEMPQYGIESIMVADGPHGLRKQPEEADMLGINDSIEATSFPTAVLSACGCLTPFPALRDSTSPSTPSPL